MLPEFIPLPEAPKHTHNHASGNGRGLHVDDAVTKVQEIAGHKLKFFRDFKNSCRIGLVWHGIPLAKNHVEFPVLQYFLNTHNRGGVRLVGEDGEGQVTGLQRIQQFRDARIRAGFIVPVCG